MSCAGGLGEFFWDVLSDDGRWVTYVILYGVVVMLLGGGGCNGVDGSSLGEKDKG